MSDLLENDPQTLDAVPVESSPLSFGGILKGTCFGLAMLLGAGAAFAFFSPDQARDAYANIVGVDSASLEKSCCTSGKSGCCSEDAAEYVSADAAGGCPHSGGCCSEKAETQLVNADAASAPCCSTQTAATCPTMAKATGVCPSSGDSGCCQSKAVLANADLPCKASGKCCRSGGSCSDAKDAVLVQSFSPEITERVALEAPRPEPQADEKISLE